MSARRTLAGAALLALVLTGCPSTSSPGDGSDGAPDAVDVAPDEGSPDVQPEASPDVPPPPSGIGNECAGGSGFQPEQGDCADEQVCLTERHGFPNGYCVQSCQSTDCPADAECVTLGGRYPVCLRRCAVASDCRVLDGYVCRPSGTGSRVCVPTDGPVGLREGEACYTTTPGPHQAPALERRTFAGANLSVSAERADTVSEAEGNVVASPLGSAVVGSYIAQSRAGVFMGSSTTRDGSTVLRAGATRDPVNPLNSDPVLAYTRDGALRMVFLGYRGDAAGRISNMRVRFATSMDDGQTWGEPAAIDPEAFCGTMCDKPWIVAGPGPGDAGTENLYVGYMVQRGGATIQIVVQRSEDGGASWSEPVVVGGIESVGGSQIVPNLVTLAVGGDGTLHAVYAGLRTTGGSTVRFGDPGNRVVYRSSRDGGRTWSPARRVSAASDAVVYEQPIVAVDGDTIYAGYVAGVTSGAWDVMLATSTDGGTSWRHRKVNDDPDSCATHAFPWLVADPVRARVHVMWLENRFGEGAVAYAACPREPDAPCGRNEQVNDRPFTFATSRDPSRWHGDYQSLTLSPAGELWALWSDTRTGSPAMYLARGRVP